MKKLLLILSAVLVSVTSVFAGLNPYAYNLSSSWDEANSQLTVRFKLNAHPNMTGNNSGRGIQILAIDPSNNNKQYYIYGVPGTLINEKIAANSLDYELTIPITGKTWDNKDFLPVGRNLTWAVKVAGLNKKDKDTPTEPVYVNQDRRPYSCHGVAVNNNQNSPDFGSIYVTEAAKDDELSGTWAWLQGKGKALLKYDPRMQDAVSYRKSSPFSDRNLTKNLLEPHRVCVSEDGRVFVSSYNRNTRDDQVAVWELKNGVFTPVIYHNTYGGMQGVYGDRVCGMAVKGSGSNLRILLCFLDEYDGTNESAFRMYEYDLNNLGTNKNEGEWRGSYQPDGKPSDGSTASVQGAFTEAIQNNWYFYSDGLANVSYLGNGHVLAVDFFVGYGANAVLRYYEGTDKKSENAITASNKQGYYYGGAGLLAYQDDDGKYIVSGRTYYYGYESNPNTNETNGRIHTYTLSNTTTISSSPKSGWSLTGVKTRNIINAMAMDCAKNIYAVSFTDGSEDVGTGQLLAFAMPYSGETTTIAPSSNVAANKYFSIPPVPNIYATNLRYEAVEGAPKYKFSFNVNTKPKYAEIRFYKSYESMKKSLSVVNADDFNGGQDNRDADLYCYYPITSTSGLLKQGKIDVVFGMVGGIIDQQTKQLTNACLPRGELYWSVYVETDKSSAFAPIYRQPLTGADAHYRLHATVNNYPETDQFGAVYAAQEDKRDASNNKRSSLMIYEINDNGGDVGGDVHDLNNTTRYQKTHEYLYATGSNPDKAFPRRMTVAPDGLLYIAHQGDENKNVSSVAEWKYGGIYTWNPNDAVDANGKIKLSLFSYNEIGTSTAVVLYPLVNGNDTTWKLYATNTYNEYGTHGQYYDTVAAANINKFGWNGFVEYVKDKNLNWTAWNNINTPTNKYQLGRGDESGNVSLAATDYGMWLCQYREHNVEVKKNIKEPYADNKGAYVLSFVPYGQYSNSSYAYGPRTWRSCTTDGGRVVINSTVTTKNEAISDNSQTETAPLQSTPGGGMTYKKVKISDTQFNEYLYIVNHDGDIVQWKIEWADNNTRPRMYIDSLKILKTPTETKGVLRVVPTKVGGITTDWTTAAITSMCFDFAGNLVTTTGVSYFDMDQLQNEASELAPEGGQNIIIYTMPYDRTNAREIQAPKSNIFIPERLAQLNMTETDIQNILTEHQGHGSQCYIDLYRPMQGGMFNTFCVPFALNTTLIPTDHPLYGAEIRRFTGVTLSESGGEKILTLNFENLINNTMAANVPHIIKPQSNIKSIIPFDWVLTLAQNTTVAHVTSNQFDNDNTITYQGILPKTDVNARYDLTTNLPLRLILVADNRLAVLTGNGEMYGFRGYFDLAKPLPPGTVAKISAKKDTPTNTTIVVDGKKVNIDKYLREGRVYIRVGDSLYTIDGQVVK